MTAWVWVIVAAESAIARAMPKSITFTAPVGVSITLAGLMSRCTMPAWWEYPSAERTPAVISTASSIGTACPSRRMSRTVCPSTYSITMNGTCDTAPVSSVMMSSPVSYTATTEGWLSEAAACASRRKRAWKDGSRARSERRILMATVRPSRVSCPMCTSAMPPRPIRSPTSYLLARIRGASSTTTRP